MSYAFTVTGAKSEVRSKIESELDRIIKSQPMHTRDRDAAVSAAMAFTDLVTVPEGKQVKVSVSGSVGWSSHEYPPPADVPLSGAGVSVSASVV